MRKISYIFFSLVLLSCQSEQVGYVDTFKTFVEGVAASDMTLVKGVSTDVTAETVSYLLEHNVTGELSHNLGCVAHIAKRKSSVQLDIVITADSISQNRNTAWVKFRMVDIAEEFIIRLIRFEGSWLVDIPLVEPQDVLPFEDVDKH